VVVGDHQGNGKKEWFKGKGFKGREALRGKALSVRACPKTGGQHNGYGRRPALAGRIVLRAV